MLSKCLGSTNPHNAVKATFTALRELRRVDDVAADRGSSWEEMVGSPRHAEPEAPAEAPAAEAAPATATAADEEKTDG